MYTIKGNTGDWEVVIGLEVHAQVSSNAKLFSGSCTEFGAEPNNQVSFVDAAMPGMLPVLNEFCVEQAVKTGLGLNAKINLVSMFDRKNYFYPDLPQGYQISQFYHPIVGAGRMEINVDGEKREINIERLHLEQDAGKSIHDQSPDSSFIDLNRCGVALMEIVSAPDIRSPKEAAEYVKKLRGIVRYLGTCDGDMDKGSMRCDANVSVRRVGDTNLNNRCEIKNLNSMRFIMKAIEYEAERQVEIYEEGGEVDQETRLFDTETGETRTMRSKEDNRDYRYFPDPDLMPVTLTEEYVKKIKDSLPELPEQKIKRYTTELNLSLYDAEILTLEKETAVYFEEVIKENDPKMAANWISAELFGRLNKAGVELKDCKITPEKLSGLLKLISSNVISGKIAKDVFDIMFETGSDAAKIVEEKGLQQVTNTDEIEALINKVLEENPDKVAEYRGGKDRLFPFFIGQVMKLSKGKANPALVNDLLKEKL
ncbi:MAG: Asp-tRNA(Asn)/Glu-tRNA(Gln) amidotransferase subunit GatB [Rickettsiales bacterium]|jgi:aspartyl-tRNA(Asn)/glutamyl-tRNA(Gln) amidotransferase subunit B|nr:Asp-tRNA(Asn)/Glu-tRNA(Gln) amidotransferase subunit GatB [Rickettsiales bacterium]